MTEAYAPPREQVGVILRPEWRNAFVLISDPMGFLAKARAAMRVSRVRKTHIRTWILEILASADRPLTPVEVQAAITEKHGEMGRNTVTRTLWHLRDHGLLARISSGRYVPLPDPGDPRAEVEVRLDTGETALSALAEEVAALYRERAKARGLEVRRLVVEVDLAPKGWVPGDDEEGVDDEREDD